LRYLVAQRYVEANLRLGESNNSKIVFMDPKALSEGLSELISSDLHAKGNQNSGGSNGSSPPES